MQCNTQRLIEALITAHLMEMQLQHKKKKVERHCVVTISRGYGALGKEVAQLLADTLGTRCCDRYILQEVARLAHQDEDLIEALDEHVSKLEKHWWEKLLHRENSFSHQDYYYYLVKVVLSISRTGGVIVGRGANIILGAEKAFRVRITGSLEACMYRIADREQINPDAAQKRVLNENQERAAYVRKLYGEDIDDTSLYDLVINSDRYKPAQMVDIILVAMRDAGQPLPKNVLDSLNS